MADELYLHMQIVDDQARNIRANSPSTRQRDAQKDDEHQEAESSADEAPTVARSGESGVRTGSAAGGAEAESSVDEAPTVARSGESGVRTGSADGGTDPPAGDTDPDPGNGYSGITPSGRWSARSIDLRPQKFDPRQIRAYTGLNQFTIDPAKV
jgi:hypothetical protein